MDKKKHGHRVTEDPDFIWSPKYEYSLDKFEEMHDEGIKDSHIAKLLLLESEEEVEQIFQEAVEMLRKELVRPNRGENE